MTVDPEIQNALDSTFGTVDSCEPLNAGGLSGATILAVEAKGQRYVLRKSVIADVHGHEFRSMKIASDAGVAPKTLFVDETTGVSIMERVAAKPGFMPDTRRIVDTLHRLHAAPLFEPTAPMPDMLRLLESELTKRAGMKLPADVEETLNAMLARNAKYTTRVSCHRDLNPTNILDTGDRVYLVDWEVAGPDDPFFDLGQLGVFGFNTPDRYAELLEAYLGRAPSAEERAHAAASRVLALAFYAAGNAMAAAIAKRPLNYDGDLSSLQPFFAKLGQGHPLDPAEMARAMLGEMRMARAAL